MTFATVARCQFRGSSGPSRPCRLTACLAHTPGGDSMNFGLHIDLVGRYREAGAARVNVALCPPVDHDALDAWTREVIPAFR